MRGPMLAASAAAAAAAGVLLLSGCVATGQQMVTDASRALADAPLCCAGLSTAKRGPLPKERVELDIDAKAQAFDFGGNKAFFVLYELPAFSAPYGIVVTSVAGGTQDDAALFIPRIATYDAAFKPLRYFDEKTLRNRGNNLERTVFVNPENGAERYIAIYGSDLSASIERAYSMVTVTPVMAGPVMFQMYGGRDGKSVLRSSPTGKLTVEVRAL